MKTVGALLLLVTSSALIVGCSTVVCTDDNDCCEEANCCEGEACNPPVSHGVAIPWESFDGDRAPAPSGTLALKLTSGEGFCAEPWVGQLSCDGSWDADIPLPPSLQFAGAKASLADLADLGGATFRRADAAEGDSCQMGEGSFTGNLEVVAINEFNVTVRVTTDEPALADLEAEYTVPRCQNPELPQQAVALVQSKLDSIYPTKDSEGFGAEPEPAVTEPLHVFIDQSEPAAGAVCEDPLGTLGECVSRSTLTVVLGVDHQFPGTYTVADGVAVSSMRSSEEACFPESEVWATGTIDVLAITPKLVHVRVTDAEGLTADAVATRCF